MWIILQAVGSMAALSGEPGRIAAGWRMGAEVVYRTVQRILSAVLAPEVAAGWLPLQRGPYVALRCRSRRRP
jgi:hypothetical protein